MGNASVILILLISYISMLLMITGINKIKPGVCLYLKIEQDTLKWLNYIHAISVVIMLLPLWMVNALPAFLLSFPDRISVLQAITFLVSFCTVGFFPWKKFNGGIHQPGIISSLPVVHILLYALLRIVFLMVYEWFFRGLLLVSFSLWLGTGWGIAVNIFLYMMMHVHKNKKEMIGCIPLGLLLCVFAAWWQSIWPAVIFHLQIAIINEGPPLQKFISPQKQAAL